MCLIYLWGIWQVILVRCPTWPAGEHLTDVTISSVCGSDQRLRDKLITARCGQSQADRMPRNTTDMPGVRPQLFSCWCWICGGPAWPVPLETSLMWRNLETKEFYMLRSFDVHVSFKALRMCRLTQGLVWAPPWRETSGFLVMYRGSGTPCTFCDQILCSNFGVSSETKGAILFNLEMLFSCILEYLAVILVREREKAGKGRHYKKKRMSLAWLFV